MVLLPLFDETEFERGFNDSFGLGGRCDANELVRCLGSFGLGGRCDADDLARPLGSDAELALLRKVIWSVEKDFARVLNFSGRLYSARI